jgi:hypothetical protein
MRQIKFGAIFMISIMGLAAIGVGYAHWEETIYVEGIMHTDDIDPAFYFAISNDPCESGFMPDPWECGVWDKDAEDIDNWHGARKAKNVGCTDVEILPDPNTDEPDHLLHIVIKDAYPCYYTHPYFEIVNYGSVPVNLYSYKLTELSFDPDDEGPINPVEITKNIDLMEAGTIYYVRWFQDANDEWQAQVRQDVTNPDNWDFSIERTDDYEMGKQLDPWRWGHTGDTQIDPSDHIPEEDYVDLLYGDLCIHFLNGCEQLAMYDFNLELVFWNWPEGGEGCTPEGGIGCNGDVILTLDSSGSIEPDDRALAATAAEGFVDILTLDNARIGVVNFSDNAVLEIGLSDNAAAIKAAIQDTYTGWDPAWMTNIFEALTEARAELASIRDRPDLDYPDYIVLITDGVPTVGPGKADCVDLADDIKAEGTTIFVIGVLSAAGVDEAFCTDLASPNGYYPAEDWEDLAGVLASLINCPPLGDD